MRDEHELLAQRFLDGELSRPERRALLQLLGEQPGLRQQLVDDEAMLDAAANLPRLLPQPDFVARTLARLPAPIDATGPRQGVSPRHRARWIPAAAAAAMLLMATSFWLGRSSAPVPVHEAVVTGRHPEGTEALVRLVLIEPRARSVAIVGDFNGWDPARSPLEQLDSGVWSTTLVLPQGRYHYMFLVDGDRWVADPLAAETTMDGFGARNSVLNVEI